MPFASLRNAIPRKTNKERAQPASRKKHGLLEKHKDYVLRARDFQRKQATLKQLRSKAAMRNPDEFYFAMQKSRTKAGVHQVEHDDASLPHGHIALLKTQDLGYVHMKRAVDLKKAEKLQSGLHFLMDQPPNKHTVFVDSEQEAEAFDPAAHFETVPELASRAFNRPRKETLEHATVQGAARVPDLKRARKERDKAYAELGQRLERAGKMRRVLDRMAVEKAVMTSKGRKWKVKDAEDGKPPVYKWKRERRR